VSPHKKTVFAWCMYDWANSSFATTIIAAFFPFFFKNFWNHGVDPAISTARLGLATSIGGLMVALLSPMLGALADANRAKKNLLALFMLLGIAATASFYFVPRGQWKIASVLIIAAEIGFSCGNLFYDSLLVNVAAREEMDMVSSRGFAFGYAGGGLLFVMNILMTWKPALFGIATKEAAVKLSFLTVAAWWLIFSLPLFFYVQEIKVQVEKRTLSLIGDGFCRLKKTFLKIIKQKHLWMFLLAYWLYIDGVFTVMTMATDFGLAIGLSPVSLMLSILLVQFVAMPSSIFFGHLARWIGTEKAILCGIAIYLCVCTIGVFSLHTAFQFMLVAALVGLGQGGVQALSRSYFGKLVPVDDAAEYFGFLNLVGKCSSILGPFLVGVVAYWLHAAGIESPIASRCAMASLVLIFAGGAALLFAAESQRRQLRETV
jgi:MFS transporter, UMF1 family